MQVNGTVQLRSSRNQNDTAKSVSGVDLLEIRTRVRVKSYGFKTHSPEIRTIFLPLLGNAALHNYEHTDELPVSMTNLNMLQFQPFSIMQVRFLLL